MSKLIKGTVKISDIVELNTRAINITSQITRTVNRLKKGRAIVISLNSGLKHGSLRTIVWWLKSKNRISKNITVRISSSKKLAYIFAK